MNHKNQDLLKVINRQPYPLLFITISGSHLYGFASADSDYDLRGVHILPIREIIGLNSPRETIELLEVQGDGLPVDLVTHELKKFLGLLLKKNGYVLEHLYSPLGVIHTPASAELKELAKNFITRHHAHHYLGFSHNQWKLFAQESSPRVKLLLYVFRVLLTGIYLMQTGKIEANIVQLNQEFNLSYIPDLIARKIEGSDASVLPEFDRGFYESEFQRLSLELETAYNRSHLPNEPSSKKSLNDWLVRVRLEKISGFT
jgi:hypothetical protein